MKSVSFIQIKSIYGDTYTTMVLSAGLREVSKTEQTLVSESFDLVRRHLQVK